MNNLVKREAKDKPKVYTELTYLSTMLPNILIKSFSM